MLWSVTDRIAIVHRCFISPRAIVNLTIFILLQLTRIKAALPPGAEDEIVLIEHLPGRRVHLQDFFWTGVEDAPSWLDPEQTLTLYQTHTVHHTATVYVPEGTQHPKPGGEPIDGSQKPIDCASCIDPSPTIHDVEQDIGVLVGDDPGPRYWLLTVLKAGEDVPPKVELRLARLYKAAFSRQQQKHLGLLPPEIHPRRSPKRQIVKTNNQTSIPTQLTTEAPLSNETSTIHSELRERSGISLLRMRAVRIAKTKRTLPILESEEFEELALNPIAVDEPIRNDTSEIDKAKYKSKVNVGLVQVRMQNMSTLDDGATRLIYSVHLDGKPVPAETAAKDMALLSAQEVALELGAPVIIQSEPYLKESRPLALSRKRDAWLLVGAASAGFILLAIVVIGLLILTKRKRAQSAVAAPPHPRGGILGKDEEYAPTTPGIDNTAYTSETEGRTEVTSGHRRTTGSLSRTPGSQDTIEADVRDISSENELDDQKRNQQQAKPWDTKDYADIAKKGKIYQRVAPAKHMQRGNGIDRPRSPDSVNSGGNGNGGSPKLETFESLEKGFGAPEEATGSPHSYLSMPSCKQFPNMRSVEPLSKVLEPVVVKHLDLELDSPEMKGKDYDYMRGNGDHYFARASSATKDPGVLGPIVWDLKRKRAVEGNFTATETYVEPGRVNSGAVGRARRRLNELLEDSFSLFGSRGEPRQLQQQQQQQELRHQQQQRPYQRNKQQDSQSPFQNRFQVVTEVRGKSAHVSSATSASNMDISSRPRTTLPMNEPDFTIPETGTTGPQPRNIWGSRPLSAGPFHRPSLPEVDVVRVLADSQLKPEDPAVPLIAAIKQELNKFSYD